jgi:hypothetical protein
MKRKSGGQGGGGKKTTNGRLKKEFGPILRQFCYKALYIWQIGRHSIVKNLFGLSSDTFISAWCYFQVI